jgi:hypothetical protein
MTCFYDSSECKGSLVYIGVSENFVALPLCTVHARKIAVALQELGF